MKGEINLLPRNMQRGRLRRFYLARMRWLVRAALVIVVLLGVGEVGILLFYYSLARGAAYEARPLAGRDVQQTVREHNGLLAAIEARVRDQVVWSERLKEVLARVTQPVTVHELAADAAGTLTVQGRAPASAAVVELQQALEHLPWVARVEAPLTNFAVGPEATFSLTLVAR